MDFPTSYLLSSEVGHLYRVGKALRRVSDVMTQRTVLFDQGVVVQRVPRKCSVRQLVSLPRDLRREKNVLLHLIKPVDNGSLKDSYHWREWKCQTYEVAENAVERVRQKKPRSRITEGPDQPEGFREDCYWWAHQGLYYTMYNTVLQYVRTTVYSYTNLPFIIDSEVKVGCV